jgi:hypothetical protein
MASVTRNKVGRETESEVSRPSTLPEEKSVHRTFTHFSHLDYVTMQTKSVVAQSIIVGR